MDPVEKTTTAVITPSVHDPDPKHPKHNGQTIGTTTAAADSTNNPRNT
jgi:hypothetical protein